MLTYFSYNGLECLIEMMMELLSLASLEICGDIYETGERYLISLKVIEVEQLALMNLLEYWMVGTKTLSARINCLLTLALFYFVFLAFGYSLSDQCTQYMFSTYSRTDR
jgi:hypothetical protein